jgi:hypothetical protein
VEKRIENLQSRQIIYFKLDERKVLTPVKAFCIMGLWLTKTLLRKEMIMKKLTQANTNNFFKNLKPGEIFTYSQAFLLRDVIEMAQKEGITITYAKPGTKLYKEYGSCSCVANIQEKYYYHKTPHGSYRLYLSPDAEQDFTLKVILDNLSIWKGIDKRENNFVSWEFESTYARIVISIITEGLKFTQFDDPKELFEKGKLLCSSETIKISTPLLII